MSCPEYKSDLIELARGGGEAAARVHAEACPECARFLDEQIGLTDWERALAVEAAAPAFLEARLMAEFVMARRRGPRRWAWVGAGAIAASLLIAWLEWPTSSPKPQPVAARVQFPAPVVVAQQAPKPQAVRHRRRRTRAPESDPPFLQIPYTQPLAPWERAEVVRMEMPVSALIAAGFPVETSDTAAEASADVIVGEDGRARAVRLISISEGSIRR